MSDVLTPEVVKTILMAGLRIDPSKSDMATIIETSSLSINNAYIQFLHPVESSETYVVYHNGYMIILPRYNTINNSTDIPVCINLTNDFGNYLNNQYSFIARIKYVSLFNENVSEYELANAVVEYTPINSVD